MFVALFRINGVNVRSDILKNHLYVLALTN